MGEGRDRVKRTWMALAIVALAGAPAGWTAPGAQRQRPAPTVVLVSLDGFRWDYLDRFPTPNLHRLAARGVRARWLTPVFPTLTFPNHYSIITGLLPVDHGIVSNQFVDPTTGRRFRYTDTLAVRDSTWWGGEPLWVTAERQGRRSAVFFWPGSEAAIEGVRPSNWKPYREDVPWVDRVDSALAWLDIAPARRPSLITLYWPGVDHVGHDQGPDAPEVGAAVAVADSLVGRLLDRLGRRGRPEAVNVIVVSDHGMAATSPDRIVVMDDYADPASVDQIRMGQFIALRARDGDDERLYRALANVPHVQLYRRSETPLRWRYRDNPRIAEIVGVADEGWTFATRSWLQATGSRMNRGEHGYDDTLTSMRGVFVAAGPAFRRGVVVAPFRNLHVYELVCAILGLRPAPNDGSLDSVRVMLRGR